MQLAKKKKKKKTSWAGGERKRQEEEKELRASWRGFQNNNVRHEGGRNSLESFQSEFVALLKSAGERHSSSSLCLSVA